MAEAPYCMKCKQAHWRFNKCRVRHPQWEHKLPEGTQLWGDTPRATEGMKYKPTGIHTPSDPDLFPEAA